MPGSMTHEQPIFHNVTPALNPEGRKIIFHNHTLPPFRDQSYANAWKNGMDWWNDMDQRGLLCVNPGDIILLRRQPENEFLSYLQELGWDFKDVRIVPSEQSAGDISTPNPMPMSFSRLHGINAGGYYLDVFEPSSPARDLAKQIGIPLYGSVHLMSLYATKSGFREAAKELGLRIPPGMDHLTSVDAVVECLEELFTEGNDAVIIKLDAGCGGYGIRVLNKKLFINRPEERRKVITSLLEEMGYRPNKDSVTVEKLIPSVVSSPSVQIEVLPNGQYRLRSVHEQLLFRQRIYYGCISIPDVSSRQYKEVIAASYQFAEFLAKQQFIGFFGMDFIITDEEMVYCIEVNMRKAASFYPRTVVDRLSATPHLTQFQAMTLYEPSLRKRSFNDLLRSTRDLCYPIHAAHRGLIFFWTAALHSGLIGIMTMSGDFDDAVSILRQAKRRLCHNFGNSL